MHRLKFSANVDTEETEVQVWTLWGVNQELKDWRRCVLFSVRVLSAEWIKALLLMNKTHGQIMASVILQCRQLAAGHSGCFPLYFLFCFLFSLCVLFLPPTLSLELGNSLCGLMMERQLRSWHERCEDPSGSDRVMGKKQKPFPSQAWLWSAGSLMQH